MRFGSIYIIKNKINDKVYIGQTVQDVNTRFKQHLKPSITKTRGSYKIYNAINKYGRDNFYFEILETNIPQNELDQKEIFYIEKHNSYKNGYNSNNGGNTRELCKIQDTAKLLKLFNANVSYNDIAKIFNVNKMTIQRTLHSLNKRKNRIVKKEDLLKYKDTCTNKQIAKIFNVSTATITREFARNGIKRGKGCSNHLNPQNNKQTN